MSACGEEIIGSGEMRSWRRYDPAQVPYGIAGAYVANAIPAAADSRDGNNYPAGV